MTEAAPGPDRRTLASYPYAVEIPPRFGDMDALRHLNNVALARIYEEARVRFTTAIDLHRLRDPGHRTVVAEVGIRYLLQAYYPGLLTAGMGVLRIGRSSYTYGAALFQDGRCVGLGDTRLVYINVEDGRPRPLPEALRAVLAAHPLACAGHSPASA